MSFEEGDRVVLRDEHSEHDGEIGEIQLVMETMFGDENYTISFEGGQEAGIPADSLEAAPDAEEDAADDEASEAAAESDAAEE